MYSVSSFGSGLSELQGVMIGLIVALILSLIGSLLIYFIFLSRKNEGRFTGFVGWLYDFFSFKKLMLESLLKIIYLFFSLLVTIECIILLFRNFLAGILLLIIGNVLIRISYEFAIIKILVCKNTSEINAKMSRMIGEKQEERTASVFGQTAFRNLSGDTCPSCGKKIKSTAKFCPFCGTHIERK